MEITAIEVFGSNVKIEYEDGSREEVENGVYERKNSNGDTVEERFAAQADIDRLAALASDFEAENPPSTAEVVEIELIGNNIEIKYADGTKEGITEGVFERKDANNETIIERLATQDDVTRLSELAADFGTPAPGDDDDTPDQGPGDTPSDDQSPDATIEIAGTENEDRIVGTTADERIDGLGGDDRLRGRAGDDVVNGGDGNDRVRGDEGNDVVNGGDGDDRVIGGSGNDTLNGNDGYDRYNGGLGSDLFIFGVDGSIDKINDFEDGIDKIDITAFSGTSVGQVIARAVQHKNAVLLDLGGGDVIKIDDFSLAQLGSDDFVASEVTPVTLPISVPEQIVPIATETPEILGTEGDDRLQGTSAGETIDALGGADRVRGRDGDDIVNGGDGNDRVRGEEGNDVVNGGNGDDRVNGDLGDDILDGGAGSDRYNGGLGSDTFVFSADGAFDKINDFENGIDVIDLSAYGLNSVGDVLANSFQHKDDVFINFADGDVLKIDAVALTDLDASDFIF